MKNDWIMDVLTDLHTFAFENEMKGLANQLQDAQLVAAIELATLDEETLLEPTHAEIAIGAHSLGLRDVKRAV